MPLTDFLSMPVPRGVPGRRPFIKMHGLRNYFVFIEQRYGNLSLPPAEIIRICDAHEGVGAEQVIAIEAPSAEGLRHGAYAFMRIHNIDGTEAEACGNATRCMAHLMFEESGRDTLLIETLGGLLQCAKGDRAQVSVTLGPIRTDWQSVPLAHDADTAHLPISCGPLKDGVALSLGNPHVVFFVPDFDAIDIPAVAPVIAADPLLTEGANVGVAQVIDGHTLRLQVWERPGILTEACGTGACAASFAARKRGYLTSDTVTVNLPGGTLRIDLLADGRAIKTGPVAFCCCGYV
jgi:diaminopimelate epimerase